MTYAELVEKAKETYESEDTPHVVKAWLLANIIYPADKSEDEKIRKMLRAYIHNFGVPKEYFGDVEASDVLTWLEKQQLLDKEELVEGALKHVARQFMNWLDASTPKDKMCLSNMECKDIEDAFLKDDWARIANYIKKKIEKQGKKDPCIGCTNDKGCVTCENGNMKETKSEPKFHPEDWISGYYTNYKVLSVNNEGYLVEDTDGNKINILFENEKFHHLWTIRDAKDGDVLASGQVVFIFKAINNIWLYCHCLAHNDGTFIAESYDILRNKYFSEVHPATKEQRDLLFQKMKEAGYEWDSENKELKKMEVLSEDERMKREILKLVSISGIDYNQYEEIKDLLEKQGKKLNADEVIEWIKTHGNFWPVVTIRINDVITKFKKDFGL